MYHFTLCTKEFLKEPKHHVSRVYDVSRVCCMNFWSARYSGRSTRRKYSSCREVKDAFKISIPQGNRVLDFAEALSDTIIPPPPFFFFSFFSPFHRNNKSHLSASFRLNILHRAIIISESRIGTKLFTIVIHGWIWRDFFSMGQPGQISTTCRVSRRPNR